MRDNMCELCLSSIPKTTQFSTLLLYDLMLLFSLILSHPLYFSYFVFFSPYLLKLLSFLFPLFVTTSLLLLGFLPVSPGLVHETSLESSESESKVGFLLSTYCSVLERLRAKTDEDTEFHQFVGLEVYKIVFHTSALYEGENSDEVPELISEESTFQAMAAPVVLKSSSYEGSCESKSKVLVANVEEKTVEVAWEEIKTTQPILKELEEFENMNCKVQEKKVEVLSFKSDKVEATKGDKTNPRRFDANANNSDNSGDHTTSNFSESPNLRKLDSNLGSYVSVRKEKDWKRTLACKLLEERHNVDRGEEGMDLLWETYEMDSSNKVKPKSNTTKNKKKKKKKKKSEGEWYDEEEEDHEEEELDGPLCCLQALKLSAGKRNLGMGKISKAIKGIGWLHSVTRQCKKGYC